MSFCLRPSTATMRRGQAPWSFWLWSVGAWVVIASAVFRGEATSPGTGLATWGPGAGVSDALMTSAGQPPVPRSVPPTSQLVAPPQPVAEAGRAAAQAKMLSERGSRWHSLDTRLRQFIDREAREAHGWDRLVVDASGDASGNAADLAFRHAETSPSASGHQPHFIIGNGSRSDDGRIEPTGRPLGEDNVRIMLIGDVHTAPPTSPQLRGLTELIDYLRAKTGVIRVQAAPGPGARRAAAAALPQEVLDLAFNRTLAESASFPTRPTRPQTE